MRQPLRSDRQSCSPAEKKQDFQHNHDGERDLYLFHRLCDVQTNISKVGEGLLRHMAVVVTNPQLVHAILLISKPVDTFA